MKLRIAIAREVLFVLLLLICFSQPEFGGTDRTDKYDGETIFRGVLFGVGPVAKLFPEYYLSPQESADGDNSKNDNPAAGPEQRIIDAFRAQDSAFFGKFGKDMQSRDPVKISQAIEGAYQQLRALSAKNDNNSHGSGGWYVHDPHRGGAQHSIPILAKWSRMSDIEKDTLVAQVAQRLGPATRPKS